MPQACGSDGPHSTNQRLAIWKRKDGCKAPCGCKHQVRPRFASLLIFVGVLVFGLFYAAGHSAVSNRLFFGALEILAFAVRLVLDKLPFFCHIVVRMRIGDCEIFICLSRL